MDQKEYAWLLKEKYQGVETEEFFKDLERLKAGEPLAYVIGWMPFLETKIYLDSHPLIPRPETEYWVERAITDISASPDAMSRTVLDIASDIRILDLCAGSGAIGVAILKHVHDCTVDFAEIDRAHHVTILKNLVENHINQKRVHIYGGNLFEKVQGPYDHILSNPPYIDPLKDDRVQESVKLHEPALALYGGEDGLEIIFRIIREAPEYLAPGGTLSIEHEPEQLDAIVAYGKSGPYRSCESLKDQYGVDRVTRFVKA